MRHLALEHLAQQAEINGVEGISWLDGEQARALEPHFRAVARSLPSHGVIRSHGYICLALQAKSNRTGGAVVACPSPFVWRGGGR